MSSLGVAIILERVVEGLDLLGEADALLFAQQLRVARDDAQVTRLRHQHALQDVGVLGRYQTVDVSVVPTFLQQGQSRIRTRQKEPDPDSGRRPEALYNQVAP